jgi:hypothetical protein
LDFSKKEKTVIIVLSIICIFSVVSATICVWAVNTPVPAIIINHIAIKDSMISLPIMPDISTLPPMLSSM